LGAGDTLMLFTDGMVEASNQHEEPFGEERLIQIAQQNRNLGASALEKLLTAAASNHCGGRFQDDASLIVLRGV